MLDYIIVGGGLAGIAFAKFCKKNNKKFVLVSDSSENSSVIAGGMYNPVVLKRFTPIWQAAEQISFAKEFYTHLESEWNNSLYHALPLYRKFVSVEEQNDWIIASDKPVLHSFLHDKFIANVNQYIPSDFGFGLVNDCGYLNTTDYLYCAINELKKYECFLSETFCYDQIVFENDYVIYKTLKSKNIVFAEGFGMRNNPFFNSLPLDGTKGEVLSIYAPNLKLDSIVKSSVFIMPLGNDYYKVGATYNWQDKTDIPTEEGKQELIAELEKLISCDYTIVNHFAGVRPTVKDRRPLLGTHPVYKNLHVLNGMGTRGVLLAPFMAKALFDYLEYNEKLDKNISIERFKDFVSNSYQNV